MADQPPPPRRAGKDPERAARRAAQLAGIDPDWNPREPGKGWSVDWQRMFAKLQTCLDDGSDLQHVHRHDGRR